MDEPPFACSAVGVTHFYFSKRRFFFHRINARAILLHKHSLWLFIEQKEPPAERLGALVRVARVELDKLRPIKPYILDGLHLVCTIHSFSPAAASTFSFALAKMRMRNSGTGAPMAAAFSKMLPSSVRMYHTSTTGSSSTV